MAGSKKFFHDRIVLLLVSINAFLAVAGSLFILLRLNDVHSTGLTVSYRPPIDAIGTLPKYTIGSSFTFVQFIIFLFAIFLFHLLLSNKTYHIRRQFSLTILGMGTLLITLGIVVSSALLAL